MATNTEARKARDRKLRAKYRKKTVTASVIALAIGLILGFVLCAVSVSHPGPISRMLGVGPVDDAIVDEPATGDEDLGFGGEDSGFGEDETGFEGEDSGFGEDETGFEGEDSGFGEDETGFEGEDSGFGEEDAMGMEEATPEPTPEATATPEPTPEPTAAPQIIPFGQTLTVQTEVNSDGTPRRNAGADPFETLNFSLKIDAHRNPTYFQSQYSTEYKLNGDEAVVQFDITLNGYTGALRIVPQNSLDITLMGATPDVINDGYQLMDKEMAGTADVAVSPNVMTTLYKRYSYTGDMRYLVVTTYVNGTAIPYWFDIGASQAAAPVAAGSSADGLSGDSSEVPVNGLTVGSEGEEVSRLQRALISKGVLQGSPDGKFGDYTADAVKQMQKRYSMEQTGVADQAFLERLYSDQ